MKQLFKASLLFLLILCAGQAKAQYHAFQVDSFSLLRDTLEFGDSVTLVYKLKNVSDSDIIFNDTISTYLKTNLDSTPLLVDRRTLRVNRGNIAEIEFSFRISSPHFSINKLTEVVIWPSSDDEDVFFSPNFDSMKHLVLVVSVLSVNESSKWMKNVRFYPNPAKDVINFESNTPEGRIRKVHLCDLQGRVLSTHVSDYGLNSIDLKGYKSGMYLLQVQFTDNTTGVYRVVKTE